MSMKVYQINVVCGSGSTGRIATDLAQVIEKNGGKSRIGYGRGESPQNIDSIKISNKLDLYVHAILTRLTDRHGLYSKKATKKLIKDIESFQPDIIHLHNIHGYYLNYEELFWFLEKYGKPVVWTLHDCWAFTGHCAHFDYVKCEKWKKECRECPQKGKYPNSILLDNSKDNFDRKRKAFTLAPNVTIVVVSEWLKHVVEESFLRTYPIKKISNGINLEIMHPVESSLREQNGLNDKRIVLGVASVWDERKGLNTFFELAQHLPEEYQIILIGLDSRQINEKPENIVAIEKLSDPNELAKWYTAADIYVNTSVEESMGLTTVEAMACGTPVIVMDATGSPELVDKGCGKIVESGNLDELIKAVLNTEKNEKISEDCIKHAEGFEKTKQYEKYLHLYKKILEKAEK